MKKRNDKGFTLVELIVVLVILAILAAILVPALLGYIDKAREKQITTNAEAAYVAAQALVTEAYGKGVKKDQVYKYVTGKETALTESDSKPSKIDTLAGIQADDYTVKFQLTSGDGKHDGYVIDYFIYKEATGTNTYKYAIWTRQASATIKIDSDSFVSTAGGWVVGDAEPTYTAPTTNP